MFNGVKKEFRTLKQFIRIGMEINKRYLLFGILFAVANVLKVLPNLFLTKHIVSYFVGGKTDVASYLPILAILAGVKLFLYLSANAFEKQMNTENIATQKGFEHKFADHATKLNYALLEDPQVQVLKEKALFPINSYNALMRLVAAISKTLEAGLALLTLSAVVSTLSIYLSAIIFAGFICTFYFFKKLQDAQLRLELESMGINHKFRYLTELTTLGEAGKDIRVYHLQPLILEKVEEFNDMGLERLIRGYTDTGKYETWANVALQLVAGLIYVFLSLQAITGSIAPDFLAFYASGAIQFSSCISDFAKQLTEIQILVQYITPYLTFLSLNAQEQNIEVEDVSLENIQMVGIAFEDVWFRYPGAACYSLEGITLNIHPGESLAIVGANGAGKTTLIKLLCRLYKPDRGAIYLNGKDIWGYDAQTYYRLLSVVFQDFQLFDLTLEENVIGMQERDATLLTKAIKEAGLYEKISRLEDGADSLLSTQLAGGIGLSGGEAQKLAIARALYKQSPLIIMDEPTAALDPYAEAEIYEQFHKISKDKTTIYISHRLASCQFCDRVVVMEYGKVIEQGNHQTLLEQQGRYSTLWQTQAAFYNRRQNAD